MEGQEKQAAVQRMQDHIYANIHSKITLKDLAKAAGYSQWHAARIFKEMTGSAPFDYIRRLRLSKAALELNGTGNKIIDIAFDFVFDSHEGFTRAFTRQFGIPPKRYSMDPKPLKLFMPNRIRDHYTKLQEGEDNMGKGNNANTVFVQIIERPQRKLILKRGTEATHYFEYCEETGCDVWEILSGIKEALYEPAGMWLPAHLITSGTSKYIQGVEVPSDFCGDIPEGFEIIDLAPCKMMVFQGEPYDDEHFEQAIGELWETMKKYDPKIYGYEWADDEAPRFQLEPQGYRGYIEARPVKKITV